MMSMTSEDIIYETADSRLSFYIQNGDLTQQAIVETIKCNAPYVVYVLLEQFEVIQCNTINFT